MDWARYCTGNTTVLEDILLGLDIGYTDIFRDISQFPESRNTTLEIAWFKDLTSLPFTIILP
jgi:hypothetical protein